jgi:hypothetical protein
LSGVLAGSGNSTPGDLSGVLAGYSNSTPGDLSGVLAGSGNSTPGDLSGVLAGSGNSTPGEGSGASGMYLIASAPSSFIVGKHSETTPDTLFAVGNGAEPGREDLAFNVEADFAEFRVPLVTPKRLEYYGQVQTKLIANIRNTYQTTDSIEFVMPILIVYGVADDFELLINVTNAEHIVTFDAEVEWEDMTPYTFGAGCHSIRAFYNAFTSKWTLSGKKYALAVS